MSKSNFAKEQLKAIVERIERLAEEKAAIAGDMSEVFKEAKGNGFDLKTLRQVLRLRQVDKAARVEADAMLDLYLHALGMTDEG